MRSIHFFSIVLALLVSNMMLSCQKDDNNTDTTAATDNALAEGESGKVIDAINAVAESYGVGKPDGTQETMEDSLFSPCATITVDTVDALKTITIDFGPVPCQCVNWDNKFRQGKITATWSGGYREAGTVITVVTSDYYAGYSASTMNKHDYVKTITNEGLNANGNLHFSVVVSAATVTLYSGETITWQSTRDREWTEGSSTLPPFDDVYLITGGASGVDRNGNAFTVTITNPLQVQFCPWIVSGTVETVHEGSPARILDYGDGECDNKATITINGAVYPISL
ncbi:MAG: hypothetical protein K1X61_12680 [Chitinophagales bacterium]|nr:hypothetical protein [Chitinophagales bacterium]